MSWRSLWPPSRSRSTHIGRRPNDCSTGQSPAPWHRLWSRRSPKRKQRPARSSAQHPPLLRAAPTAPAAAAPASPPAGLIAREIAVLRLVARGLTDAQVAEKLV